MTATRLSVPDNRKAAQKISACAVCARSFGQGERFLRLAGRSVHEACFTCTECGEQIGTLPFAERNGKAYCTRDFERLFLPKCNRCGKALTGTLVKVNSKVQLHAQCFRCAVCGCQLAHAGCRVGSEPYVSQNEAYCLTHYQIKCGRTCSECGIKLLKWYERNSQIFCEEHYKNRFGRECTVCGLVSVQYNVNFYGESYCQEHAKQLPACHACGRLVGKSGPTHQKAASASLAAGCDYADGRSLCARCVPQAVHNPEDARSVLGQVLTFFANLGLDVPALADAPPLVLLDRSAMQRLCEHHSSAHAHQKCPLGVTCSRHSIRISAQSGRQRRSEQHEVERIACLHGFPRHFLAAVLAHEVGHMYLTLRGFPQLSHQACCELTRHRVVHTCRNSQALPTLSQQVVLADSLNTPDPFQQLHNQHSRLSSSAPALILLNRTECKLGWNLRQA
uniref:LIM zinc-binding domain-containing protein n=1 Tax=Chrysotila carterae TaxID=13221 RepID=A0A7S4B5A2_CHRCT